MNEVDKEALENAIDILKEVEGIGQTWIMDVPTDFFKDKDFEVENEITPTKMVACKLVVFEDNVRVTSEAFSMTDHIKGHIKDEFSKGAVDEKGVKSS